MRLTKVSYKNEMLRILFLAMLEGANVNYGGSIGHQTIALAKLKSSEENIKRSKNK